MSTKRPGGPNFKPLPGVRKYHQNWMLLEFFFRIFFGAFGASVELGAVFKLSCDLSTDLLEKVCLQSARKHYKKKRRLLAGDC